MVIVTDNYYATYIQNGVIYQTTFFSILIFLLKAQSHWGTVWHGYTRKEQKPRTGNQRP